jgi:bifunctional non-homologous end joining protein LigD
VVESELILLGTDYYNEGKPIAYLGRETGSILVFAGTAFLTLSGEQRNKLQQSIERFPASRPAVKPPKVRTPHWVKPELLLRVRHLAGGDALKHATVVKLAMAALELTTISEAGTRIGAAHVGSTWLR